MMTLSLMIYTAISPKRKKCSVSIISLTKKLAQLVAKDHKLGAVFSMLVGENPVSLPYAVAKVYGKEFLEMEGDDLDQFEKGYQENLKSQADSQAEYDEQQANIAKYKSDLEMYCQQQGYDEARKAELRQYCVHG